MPTKFDQNKELKKALDIFAKRMEQIKKLQGGLFSDMKKALDKKTKKPLSRTKKSA